MHKLKSVKAVPRSLYTLKLAWCDGRVDRVDMSDVIHTYKLFTPLRGNPKLFRAVRVVDGGLGIAWTRAMDYSAESLHRLADSQRQTSGETSQRAKDAKAKRPMLPVSKATGGLLPGIDLTHMSTIEEMDDLEYVERMKRFK